MTDTLILRKAVRLTTKKKYIGRIDPKFDLRILKRFKASCAGIMNTYSTL